MSSPHGGSRSVHHDDPRDGASTAGRPTSPMTSFSTTQSAVHADSETTPSEEAESSNILAYETIRTGKKDRDAQSPAMANRGTTSTRSSTDSSGQSSVLREMASPSPSLPLSHGHRLSTEPDADDGMTDGSNNDNIEHLTSPHTDPLPASPVAHIPQTVAQSETAWVQVQGTQSPRIGWPSGPSAEERYMAAYSRVRSGNDVQDDAYGPGLRLYASNNDYRQSADIFERQGDSARRGSQDARSARPRDAVTATPEFALPRWQPDAEVTYCPICRAQFSFFVRKHHCRYVRSGNIQHTRTFSPSLSQTWQILRKLSRLTRAKKMWSSSLRHLLSP